MKKTNAEVEAVGQHMASQYTHSLWEMHNLALEEAVRAAERVPTADRNPALVRNEIVDKIRALAVDLPSVSPLPDESAPPLPTEEGSKR